jgi:hypothetical protein
MNTVETILLENAGKPGVLFIFPTDVAASRWADHLLRLQGGGTVAMDQFIAWDTFKRDSIRSRKQNKKSVARALRKIFISRLIQENAERRAQGRPPVFVSLIRGEWANQAASFTGWLTELLPQLGSWFGKAAGLPAALITDKKAAEIAAHFEGDDRDLYTLALRYAQFLDSHGLFEPAWETPPFDDTGTECFIFFPESLSDYGEYRELLEKSGHVKPVRVPESALNSALNSGGEERQYDTFFYTNSRSEIAEAALYIRALHEREQVPWDSIVVSIPGEENYEPYVLREFANRNNPFVKRTGKPLSAYPAGQFFRAVAGCASRDFAFSALTGLLLNRRLPWKDSGEIQKLIDFGIKNNCISSWVEEEGGGEKPVNVWEDSFAAPFGGIDPAVRRFFGDLKRRVKALRGAASFADVRKHYFSFRERFFDMDNCLPETDLVLSRCITELMYLAELEKSFPGAPAPDPFMFFVEYLGEVTYLAQQPNSGVVILPYRTAAAAPFDCHIVLGASQENLSAVFSRLGFLPRGRREQLGIADEDASPAFISLHQFNSRRPAAFFCAEHTFSGYAIPHSRLGIALKARQRYGDSPEYMAQFSPDLYRAESGFCTGAEDSLPPALHENQKQGFEAWRSRRNQAGHSGGKWSADTILLDLIRERFCRSPQFPGKISVSASSLAPYFQCSLKWLFERVLDLENVRIEAGLMEENIAGLVYHAALNLFFAELKKNNDILMPPVFSGESRFDYPALPDLYRDPLAGSVNAVFAGLPCLPPGGKPVMSALTARLLRAEQKHFHFQLEKCLAAFLSYFAGFRVTGSETAFRSERDSYFLNGTVDCMLEDARADSADRGTALIVDFKLKRLPDLADCAMEGDQDLANFQLPMYLDLAEENENRPVHTALFFSIVDAEPEVLFGAIRHIKTGAWSPKKEERRIMRESGRFQQIMNEFEKKTEQFAAEAGKGELSVFQPDNEKCGKCNYHRVCRTMYKIDREQNLSLRRNGDGS